MKKKLLYGLIGLVVALSLVGFVSCDDDDDDDDASVVATYSYTYEDEDEDDSWTDTFYFYSDATFKVTYDNYTIATGSYTGDATNDGTVTLTIKKVAKGFVDESDDTSLIAWSDDYGSASVTITIEDGEFEIDDDYFGGYFSDETFTKQ